MSGALVVFAKAPRPGAVKTRLCPPFSLAQAAALYGAMLDDVLEATARAAKRLGLTPFLTVHPAAAREELAARAPEGFEVTAQQGDDLGQRMQAAVLAASRAGHGPILLRGSDSPGLAEAVLVAALAALDRADLVLCPDRDGGYNLVGLNQPAPGLFAHPMSTGTVLQETLAHAEAQGLRAERLAAGFDIDTAGDLRLLAEARGADPELPCPRTLAYLDRNDLWRLAEPGAC